jgi:hypothetical protein
MLPTNEVPLEAGFRSSPMKRKYRWARIFSPSLQFYLRLSGDWLLIPTLVALHCYTRFGSGPVVESIIIEMCGYLMKSCQSFPGL